MNGQPLLKRLLFKSLSLGSERIVFGHLGKFRLGLEDLVLELADGPAQSVNLGRLLKRGFALLLKIVLKVSHLIFKVTDLEVSALHLPQLILSGI